VGVLAAYAGYYASTSRCLSVIHQGFNSLYVLPLPYNC